MEEKIGIFINDFNIIEECIWESGLIERKKKEYVECLKAVKDKIEEYWYKE